jgi:predicted  nucleic acid-binding Zn-ribbon protein
LRKNVNPRTELYKLQEIDVAWYRVRRRLHDIQQALQETEALVDARRNLAETEAALHQWQASQKDTELEAKSLAAKIHHDEQELMSGRVRNPKELSSLQASVEAMQRQQGALEERGVEAMLMVE